MSVDGRGMTLGTPRAATKAGHAMFSRALIFIAFLLLVFAGAPAMGATSTITATMRFETALTLATLSSADFGILSAQQSGTYTLSPTGTVTASNDGIWLGGAPSPASLTIAGSSTQGISISAGNYVAANGVTPSNATCAYDGGAAAPCSLSNLAAPAGGKPLSVGVTVVVDGSQAIGATAAPTFDIIVSYN